MLVVIPQADTQYNIFGQSLSYIHAAVIMTYATSKAFISQVDIMPVTSTANRCAPGHLKLSPFLC